MKKYGDQWLYQSAASCDACRLSKTSDLLVSRKDRPNRRAVGWGREDAPIFLIGESPRDCTEDGGPFDVRDVSFREEVADAEEEPFIRAVQGAGLHSDLFYSTTALKCPIEWDPKNPTEIEPGCRKACLTNHLGVELEYVEPPIIWVTGYYGANMVARHFRSADVGPPSEDEASRFEAPKVWRFDDVLMIRTQHPRKVESTFGDFESFAKTVQIMGIYFHERIAGQLTG